MKQFLRIFFSAEGQGNIGYDDAPTTIAPAPLSGANDGLSTDAATGTIAQLGQAVGRAGNPAILLEDREIPDDTANHFLIFLGKNNGVDDVLAMGTQIGFRISNKTGQFFEGIGTIGLNSAEFSILTDDGINIRIQFKSGTGNLIFDDEPTVNANRFTVDQPFLMDDGWGHGYSVLQSALNPVYDLVSSDSLKLIDTTGGNQVINIRPLTGGYQRQRFSFKKTSLDANIITLTMITGTIQGIGAPAATFIFNNPGESVEVYVNDTNAFII